ncbi:MAG: nitroreductase [Caulobacteraceae bacterium]|nr:nitroreductase [Caulobacteraceae bacterium]
MTHRLPPAPSFGDPLPQPPHNQAVLDLLALRRSASAAMLGPPAPSPEQLDDLLRLAARVPDHGKLFPWRFIVLQEEAKQRFVQRVEAIAARSPDAEKRRAALHKLKAPPLAVAVVSRYVEGNIPEWEQRLSAGAVCMTLLIAAQAMGIAANWITDWYSYDPDVGAVLGLRAGERVAGFVYLGAVEEPPLERARPDMQAIVSTWEG